MTIVEVAVASLLLVIGVLGGMATFTDSQEASTSASRNEVGLTLVEQALEEIRSLEYDDVKMTGAPALPDMPSTAATVDDLGRSGLTMVTDPNAAVRDGTRLAIDPDTSEELVLPGDTKPGTNIPTPGTARVIPLTQDVVGTGSTAIAARIYRYVSWRDEECPALALGNLETLLVGPDSVTTLTGTTIGTIRALAGPQGAITRTLSDIDGLRNRNLGPLGAAIRPTLNLAVGALNPIVAPLNTLNTRLEQLLTPIQTMLAPLTQLASRVTGPVSQRLDICDIDLAMIKSLNSLRTVHALLRALVPAIHAVQTAIAPVAGVVDGLMRLSVGSLLSGLATAMNGLPNLVDSLVAAVTRVDDVLASAFGSVADASSAMTNLAEGLVATIASVLAVPDHTHNTKRVTVAVVLEPRNGSGPLAPIWGSTIVADPDAGLVAQ